MDINLLHEVMNTEFLINDKTIQDWIDKYCYIKDYAIYTKGNNLFLESLCWWHLGSMSRIKFFIEHGINEFLSYNDFRKTIKSKVACCGFSEKEGKWYGWTHRGIRCFGIGDSYFNYLGGKPAKTLDECKKLAFYAVQELS